MKHIFTFFLMMILFLCAMAQQVGGKVSFNAVDGKTYTGTITEIQGEKFNVKYDGVDFSSWLTANQFMVAEPASAVTGLPAALPLQVDAQNAPTGMTAKDSLKLALANAKTAINSLSKLFAVKRDTMTINIADIDYDNSNLAQLKDDLKKLKGVRSVTMHYNANTATMEIAYKGKPADVWDNLPADVKEVFKVSEFGDNNIKVKYKQKSF